MAYCNRPSLVDYLVNFTANDPLKAGVCAFTQGGGVPIAFLSLAVFGTLGLALTVRTRHPAPILVAMMLTGGAVAVSLPGQAAGIAGFVLLMGISALGLYLYQRAQSSL